MDEPAPNSFWEDHKLEIGLALGGLLLIGLGIVWWKGGATETKVEVLSAVTEVSETAQLVVDVAGGVNKAGVYKLSAGSRVEQALQLAGGLSEKADLDWVAKYLNRSEKVTDGMKIYIPEIRAETEEVPSETNEEKQVGVNINSATKAELEGLPGVGPVSAAKIISNRPYTNLQELVEKKILSQRVFEQIKKDLTLW